MIELKPPPNATPLLIQKLERRARTIIERHERETHQPPAPEPQPIITKSIPYRFFHVVEFHPSDEKRIGRARASWQTLYDSLDLFPAALEHYTRSSLDIGDDRDLPFLKDVLELGMDEADDDDAIVLTNGDTVLHPGITDLIRKRFQTSDCMCSYRVNVKIPPDLRKTPDQLSIAGNSDFGRDLFAFRKSWLAEHWDDIPDFYVGELEWDIVLALMVREANKVPVTTKQELNALNPASDLPLGYVLHEVHERKWLSDSFRDSPAKQHNIAVAREWYRKHNLPQFDTL